MKDISIDIKKEIGLYFIRTGWQIDRAVVELEYLIEEYKNCALPQATKDARIAALKGKIGVLRDIKLDPSAFPWNKDKIGNNDDR